MEPIEAIIGVSTFIFVLLSLIKPAKCNDDIVAEKMEGNRENSELYVIGENMYLKERKYKNMIVLRCMHWKATKKHCKARANIDEESLLVQEPRIQEMGVSNHDP